LLTRIQKSKEKNIQLEEQHRRNEISMRRKQAQNSNPLSPNALSDSDAPKSPASTGAMDDLLQKLRAAKPEARDQRDRRRRARLKDKHQVRVASGQKMPEIGVNVEEGGEPSQEADDKSKLLSPASETAESEASSSAGGIAAVASEAAEADIADRAAAMLEGLQSGASINKDGSLSVRRRRESADTERQRRRNRRQQAASTKGEDGGLLSPTAIPEEGSADAGASASAGAGSNGTAASAEEAEPEAVENQPTTPVTVVHPPSPELKARDLPTPPPE
jgi:cytokinesis protein